MKFGPKITEQFCEELKKVPNIRYACKKLGIDRSTFYRWIMKHFVFHQRIIDALSIGREGINDAAESVIITGVQNGDVKCSTYWLGHNHERYVPVERVRYLQHLDKSDIEFMNKPIPNESMFEALFDHYFQVEEIMGIDRAKDNMTPLVNLVCREDPALIDIFFASYEEWKTAKLDREDKTKKVTKF